MKESTDRTGFSPAANRVASAVIRFLPPGGVAAFCLAMAAPSCTPFDVNVSTKEPIRVDLNMEVHVYQHGKDGGDEESKQDQATYKEAMTRRRNRMKEIQELKNNRLVGEDRDGRLAIRNLPAAEYGKYVKETVAAENRDRDFLMEYEAAEKGEPLSAVRRMQWRHWQRKSFPGEWIEVEGDESGVYLWVQKKEASG